MDFMAPSYKIPERQQRGLVAFPTICNVSVDSVAHHWMSLTVEDKSATYEGLVMVVGRCMGVFYAYGGMIVSKDLG